jgi:hypothetical protein
MWRRHCWSWVSNDRIEAEHFVEIVERIDIRGPWQGSARLPGRAAPGASHNRAPSPRDIRRRSSSEESESCCPAMQLGDHVVIVGVEPLGHLAARSGWPWPCAQRRSHRQSCRAPSRNKCPDRQCRPPRHSASGSRRASCWRRAHDRRSEKSFDGSQSAPSAAWRAHAAARRAWAASSNSIFGRLSAPEFFERELQFASRTNAREAQSGNSDGHFFIPR